MTENPKRSRVQFGREDFEVFESDPTAHLTEEQKTWNRIVPKTRLFFLCEKATLDLETGAWHFGHPLHTMPPLPGGQFPFLVEELWVHAQLAGGIGKFNLSVQVIDSVAGTVLWTSMPAQREYARDEQRVFDEVFKLVKLPIPRAGTYEFRLLANNSPLPGGSSSLRFVEG